MQGEDTRQEEQIQCDRRQGQQSTYHPIQLLAGPVRVGIQLPKNASQKLSIYTLESADFQPIKTAAFLQSDRA